MFSPLPNRDRLSQQLSGPGQSAEFLQGEKKVKWLIKKLLGKSEATAKFKVC